MPSLWTGMRLRVTLLWYKPCFFSNVDYFVINSLWKIVLKINIFCYFTSLQKEAKHWVYPSTSCQITIGLHTNCSHTNVFIKVSNIKFSSKPCGWVIFVLHWQASKKIVLFLYVCVSYCAGVDAVNFYVCHLLLLLIYLPYVSGCDETPSSPESHFCYCLFCFNIANLIIFQHLSKYLSHSVWFTDIPSPLSSPSGSAGRKRSAVRTRQSSKHTMVTSERWRKCYQQQC